MQSLLKMQLNMQNAAGKTPLMIAAANGHLDIVMRFVSAGANINIVDNDGKTAFDLAKNHVEVASFLGKRMCVKFQEEVKFEDALKINEKLLQIQEESLGRDDSETNLTRDRIGRLRSLLYLLGLSDTMPPSFLEDMDHKRDDGKTPLHVSAAAGNLLFVKRLVSNGANINILDNDGKTAFDLAKQHVEVASYLGHVMCKNFIMEAKYDDAQKIYQELLQVQEGELGSDHSETNRTRDCLAGLHSLLYLLGLSDIKPPSFMKDMEEKNGDGKTPLHSAAETGRLGFVQRLVSVGVNINILDSDGKTAFDLGKNHVEVASFLGYKMSEGFIQEGKCKDALKILEELLTIQEETLGSGHSETATTQKYILDCIDSID